MTGSKPWFDYEGVRIEHVGDAGAYRFRTSHVTLDADGSPRAYHPQDIGIDANANAGYPHRGWRGVLVVDPADSDRPYVQPTADYAGNFVSKTSLRDRSGAATAPSTYVNAETIPYIVFPGAFYGVKGTGRYGDLAMVRSLTNGCVTAAIVADGGPFKAPLGEMSIALASALGGVKPKPRNSTGAPKGTIEYIVFAGSALNPKWPQDWATIDVRASELLTDLGGWNA